MLIIDIILLIILLALLVYGWRTGLIKTVGGLIGLIVGIILASRYFQIVADWVLPIVDNRENLAKIIGYLVVFVAVNVIIGIFVSILTSIFKIIPFLTTLNRLSGAILGLIAGVFGIGFLIIMIDKFPFSEFVTKYFANSELVPCLVAVASYLTPLLPEAVEQAKGILNI